MPIREALAFIKAHGRGLSYEVLIDQLRKKGYAEDEIEEAMYIAKSEGVLGGKPLEGLLKSARPTLWEAVARKAGENDQSKLLVREKPKKDWSKTIKTLGFWIGVFSPGALYYFSLPFFTFIELFFAPFLDQSLPVAIVLIFSGALYFFLRRETPNFASGLPAGIAALFIWSLLNF